MSYVQPYPSGFLNPGMLQTVRDVTGLDRQEDATPPTPPPTFVDYKALTKMPPENKGLTSRVPPENPRFVPKKLHKSGHFRRLRLNPAPKNG